MRLHINIDHVATLRNQRDAGYPDPVAAAVVCERAGADGITAHLREDRRHIRDEDMHQLRKAVTTVLNFECAATEEMLSIVESVRPDVVSLVPERREERTTEGGLDLERAQTGIVRFQLKCAELGIKLSLFVEPEPEAMRRSSELGVAQVELHTGRYSHLRGAEREGELGRIREAASLAADLGLEVAAGHGLTRENVGLIAAIPEVVELNIGHAVICDSVFLGLESAVREMRSSVVFGCVTMRSTS